MLKSNGVWMPPGRTCARAVWADPPICTGNWKVWQYWVRATPIVVKPVCWTSAPVRLLPIRLTVDPLVTEDQCRGPLGARDLRPEPARHVDRVELVGSPLIWTRSTFPVTESTSSSTS